MPNKNKKSNNTKPKNSRGGKTPQGRAGANPSNNSGRRQKQPNRPVNGISTNTYTGKRLPTTTMSNGATIVSHTETFGVNITGTSEFAVASQWALQPGLSSYSRGSPLGSWLPQIATNFDSYEILELRFAYRAACSTLEPGLIVFGFEPNPEGSTPVTYQEMRNMLSVDGSAHANLSFDISGRCRKSLLTRKGSVVNLPSYDAGRVFLATIGCGEAAKLGFVDVHYKVRLFNPQSDKSTTIPTTVYSPVAPVYRVEYLPTSDRQADCSALCFQASQFMTGGGVVKGASDMFTLGSSLPALDTTIYGGCVFKNTTQVGWTGLRAAFGGRYKVRFQVSADFLDLRLFTACPFTIKSGSSTLAVAQSQGLASVGGTGLVSLECLPTSHRGYTGVVSLDPNPGTDMGLYAAWDVDLAAGETLYIAVGYRNYNNVSVTGSTCIFRAGLGVSYIEVTYLGPSLGA